jgi:hypothetical protein
MASSLGKMPTTSVRRLISPLCRSRPLVGWIFDQWVGLAPVRRDRCAGQSLPRPSARRRPALRLARRHLRLSPPQSRIVSVAVIIAVGVNTDCRWGVPGMDIGPSEVETHAFAGAGSSD